MSVTRIGLVALAVGMVLFAGCAETDSETVTQGSEPATAAEIAVLCDRYAEVRDLEIGRMWTELIEVAPGEIRGSLVRLTGGGPGENYWADRGIVEGFLEEHCPGVP